MEMRRNVQDLTGREFDVLIIGAGVYGAALAWDAASRGLSVAVIDQADFGAKTSANSLKTVHGGLRYLQTLDLKRVFESVTERKTYLKIASHLVHPLPVVMPTKGHAMKGPEILWAGLLANDILSCTRNTGMDPQKKIPMGRIISRAACYYMLPGIHLDKVSGGASWTDAQMYSTERMTLAFIQSAVQAGAVAVNYLSFLSFLKTDNKVCGIETCDVLNDREVEIRAKLVINAAGGWVDKVIQNGGPFKQQRVNLSTAMNIVVNKNILSESAAGIYSRFRYNRPDGKTYRGSRVLFVSPWRDYTIIGTFHKPYDGHPDALSVRDDEIFSAIEEFNGAYPGSLIQPEDVSFAHKGFLPMSHVHSKTGEVNLSKHYRIIDHAREDKLENVISVIGVKYTTARDVAQKVIDLAAAKLSGKAGKCITSKTPLVGGDIHRFSRYMQQVIENDPYDLDNAVIGRLIRLYGTEYPEVLRYIDKDAKWGQCIDQSNVMAAEIVHAVESEMAQKLSDVVLRRTDLGSGKNPGDKALRQCAEIMAAELGWDAQRINSEIEEVKAVYPSFSK